MALTLCVFIRKMNVGLNYLRSRKIVGLGGVLGERVSVFGDKTQVITSHSVVLQRQLYSGVRKRLM